MDPIISAALKNWVPVKLVETPGNDHCRWLYLGDKDFTEPFFDDTIHKCRGLAPNAQPFAPVSSLDVLPQWSECIDSVPPAAFIFHVSRCGSTLIAQLLGLDPAHIVLSEVPFIDEVLRSSRRKNGPDLPYVKAAIALYGARRQDQNTRLFIKTDTWHVHFYRELRTLYPQVPFLLLYRRPDEVLRSQQKKRGMQSVPGVIEPSVFNFSNEDIEGIGLDEYMAKVLERNFEAYLRILQTDKLAIPVNYNEGAIAIVEKLAAATGTPLAARDLELMRQRTVFHGKYPDQTFEEPPIEAAIPPYLERAFEGYGAVESIRKQLLTG